MLRSHLSVIRYECRDETFAADSFKFRNEMLRIHAFWYDLFRLDAICQFMVTRSVMIESPVQIRSHTSENDYPDRVQDYHDRGSRFGAI